MPTQSGALRESRCGAILTINAGSSSIRFAAFEASTPARREWHGKLDRIGGKSMHLSVQGMKDGAALAPVFATADAVSSARQLIDWLVSCVPDRALRAVGHRVVHGLEAVRPQRIDAALMASMRRMMPFDPDHLPLELQLIEAAQRAAASVPQFACFDTSFHRDMPILAQMLPIPRRYFAKGVRRYGFHGLSYEHLVTALRHIGEPAISSGRVVLAHLGSGASVAAVRNGRCIDTSMSFTPAAGLVMGSRSGDLDPGLLGFLAHTEQMSIEAFTSMVNHDSGMFGISETSSDVRDLLALEASDARAAEALDMFCQQTRKWIASMAAALGGLDLLVFTGGVGENAPVVRERICDGLGFLGVGVDNARNKNGEPIISPDLADVRVRVIRSDEESVIANAVVGLLEKVSA